MVLGGTSEIGSQAIVSRGFHVALIENYELEVILYWILNEFRWEIILFGSFVLKIR